METHLTRIVRDNAGHIHKRGEHVTILGHWLELGTHRDLLRARWDAEIPPSCCLRTSRRIGHNDTHFTTFDSPAR